MRWRILHVNTLDLRGGAAKLAYRLHKALLHREHTSQMLVGIKQGHDAEVEAILPSARRLELDRRLHLSGLSYPTFRTIARNPCFETADILHLHNLHGGYFNVRALPRLVKKRPSIWTLHDPWLIHELGTVAEYDPVFPKDNALLGFAKARSIAASDPILVAPSRWLAAKVEAALDRPVRLIPHGIDTSLFAPRDRLEARHRLSLPPEATIVLFLAHGGEHNVQKGAHFLEMVREASAHRQVLVLTVGSREHGTYVESEDDVAFLYSAADVFVLPSLAENQPLTIMEAIACGTPVVAFRTGGVPEMVRHLENGYIAAYGDGADLARGVELVLSDKALCRRARSVGPENASRLFGIDRMVDDYINLYGEAAEMFSGSIGGEHSRRLLHPLSTSAARK